MADTPTGTTVLLWSAWSTAARDLAAMLARTARRRHVRVMWSAQLWAVGRAAGWRNVRVLGAAKEQVRELFVQS